MRGVPDFSPAQLRALRQAAGMSQEALATAVGTDKSNVSHWEGGRRRPGPATLADIAQALGSTIGQLTARPDDPASARSLAQLRRDAGLTQNDVAQRLGVNRATYGAIERGAIRTHPAARIAQFAELFAVEETVVLAALRLQDTAAAAPGSSADR